MSDVNVFGAGLCGSLLSILLRRRGFAVTLREARPDPRQGPAQGGRSINLALSARGIRALKRAGVFEHVEPLLMPMAGRMIHDLDGNQDFQSYGQRAAEVIYSVSRTELNRSLVEAAIDMHGVDVLFEHAITDFDPDTARIDLEYRGKPYAVTADAAIAADGAGSLVRRAYAGTSVIAPQESLLGHGYKELTIPAQSDGSFALAKDALHIWPRGEFMLIALPNPGGDFTLTLFLPNDGENGFSALQTSEAVARFFDTYFPSVVPLIPHLVESFLQSPTGILGTVRCQAWHDADKILLIGDAAHAIVPFHGQGMNLAFEDCIVIDDLVGAGFTDWKTLFADFQARQLPNANAIAEMALENYVEMRATVLEPKFVLQKSLAFELERRLPDRFIPQYSMVMFHDEIPYAVAQARGRTQAELLQELSATAERLADIDMDAAAEIVAQRMPPLPS